MRPLIVFILLFNSYMSFAQLLSDDQARHNIKWEQINTKNFRLIFPREYREQASLLSRTIPDMQSDATADLGVPIRKINILLHATNIEQNGFVQLAPRKTEFYPIPSGVASNVEWLPNLAVHELRHVAQMDKMTGRFRKPFFELLGFGLFGIQLPAWYFEGDAVATETRHSQGGRGRLPSWFMPLRANELSGRSYSFDKNILGSFKDITPSYYTTGYLMNTYLTNSYGSGLKGELMEDLRRHLLRPFSFYHTLRKHTGGLNSARLYQLTIDSLRDIWTDQSKQKTQYPQLPTAPNRYPTNYFLPQQQEDGSVFVLIQKPDQIPYIARVVDGKEERITYTGRQLMPHFHASQHLLIWDEFRKDARYGKTTFNVVHIYDCTTRKTETFTFEHNAYTPALSADNSRFAVVEVDRSGQSHLALYDRHNGEAQQRISLPRGLHIQQPRFDAEGNRIITIGVQREGTSLLEFDLSTGKYTALLPWSHHQIERPLYDGDARIVYKAHYNGIDNIYALNREDGSVYALTDARFGAFNPAIGSDGALLFNDYASDGYKIASASLHTRERIDLNHTTETNYDIHTKSFVHKTAADTVLHPEVKKYSPLSHLLYFHSLTISSNDFESFDNYRPGIFWVANDLLNTSEILLGYEYDRDIRKGIYSAQFNYNRYYPKLSLRYENRGQIGQAVNPNDNSVARFDFREHAAIAEIQIPFSIYRKDQVYSFGFNFGTSYHHRYDVSVALRNFNETISFPLNYIAYFNRNRMRAKMDLMPRWGQNISMSFRHVPFEDEQSGQIFAVRTNFYFPGLMANHGLQVRAGFQHKSGRYEYNNDIPVVSGFGYFPSPKLENTLLFSYRMPLGYPDWNIAPVAFIKRFTGELFADYQNVRQAGLSPKTFGVGISADLNAFRYILPDINVGGRLVYINDRRATQSVVPMFSLSYTY